MENPSACFELTSAKIRFLVGYELDGKPILIYQKEVENRFMRDDGTIADMEGLVSLLRSFLRIEDEAARLKLSLENISLLFPSTGLKVFSIGGSTFATNNDQSNPAIGKQDVVNVLSQLYKQTPPQGYSIVDIYPEAYILDGGKAYSEPPIGESSSSLSVSAKVYCLPSNYVTGYKAAFERAGFRIVSVAVSALASARYYRTIKDFPKNYLLLDIGENITTLSLIGNGAPYNGAYVCEAGRKLTSHIARSLSISFEEAEEAKKLYGFNVRNISYSPPLVTTKSGIEVRQEDLNGAIASYFDGYLPQLDSLLRQCGESIKGDIHSLPIYLIGGSSRLNGIRSMLARQFPNESIRKLSPNTIGARDPSLTGLLGLVLTSFESRNSIKGEIRGIASLSREKEEPEEEPKKKRRPLFSKKEEDEDII